MRKLDVQTMIVMLVVFIALVSIPQSITRAETQCDAHIELSMLSSCLEHHYGWGRGWLTIQNQGAIGNSKFEVELQLTRGIGTVSFSHAYYMPRLMLILEPGQQYQLSFLVDIDIETRQYFPRGAQITAMILEEGCNPDLNIGSFVQQDSPWCPVIFLPFVSSIREEPSLPQ